jgi:chemotaxis response regulator CheB
MLRNAAAFHVRERCEPLRSSVQTAAERSPGASDGARVVGVLLSGTGDDSVSGLISITAAGGIRLDPVEADRVLGALPIADIADLLTQLARGESVAMTVPTS